MNFLAHFFLSGLQNKELTTGNFLGDFVKGKKYLQYSSQMGKGILLHRAIDSYTDEHPMVLQSKRRLFERHRHYSAVLVDLFYDHFLAVNFGQYSSESLSHFAEGVYHLLEEQRQLLPEKARFMLPYMKRDNWLVNYRSLEGIDRACQGIARRSPYTNLLAKGVEDLERDYVLLEDEFRLFFTDIRLYVEDWISKNEAPSAQ